MKCYMRSKDMTTGTGPQLGRPQPNPLCHLECKLHLRGVPTQGKGTGFSETLIPNRHCLLAVRVSQAFLSSASTGKTAWIFRNDLSVDSYSCQPGCPRLSAPLVASPGTMGRDRLGNSVWVGSLGACWKGNLGTHHRPATSGFVS